MGIRLPPGFSLHRFDELDSTNSEALRFAASGAPGGTWIVARRQCHGKGRAGRNWQSEPGNLFASLIWRPQCTAAAAPGLSLLAGVAAYGGIETATGGRLRHPALALKWPNDLLLNGGKAGGILLESSGIAGRADYAIIIGIGLNVARPPEGLDRATACLATPEHPLDVTHLFATLAGKMAHWLALWRDGENFATIRTEWLTLANGYGKPVTVHLNGSLIEGVFLGIDDSGALRLGSPGSGAPERRITAGDVVFQSGL